MVPIFFLHFYLCFKRKAKDENHELLGPKSDYTPQTEKSVGRSSAEPMNVTKALTCLGMVTGRGMDNGAAVSILCILGD